MNIHIRNLHGGVKFLIAMIFIYAVLFFINSTLILDSSIASIENFINLLPMLGLVFSIIFIVNFFLKPELIKYHLGHNSGIKGWIYASLGSIFISGPPYILFPMLKELRNQGMKYSLIALFMNNRNVSPAFLPAMAYYFGINFTVIISVYILIFAFINAIIIGWALDKKYN